MRHFYFALSELCCSETWVSQGFALGFRMLPFQGIRIRLLVVSQ